MKYIKTLPKNNTISNKNIPDAKAAFGESYNNPNEDDTPF
jgi:hypothetical protein